MLAHDSGGEPGDESRFGPKIDRRHPDRLWSESGWFDEANGAILQVKRAKQCEQIVLVTFGGF